MKQKFFSLFIAALLAAISFSSCEKVIDFEGDETEPILVMISFPDSGSPWKVRLTESRFFLSNDTIATIKNADVTTEVNGRPVNSVVTYLDNGIYDLGYTPQVGDSLTLHVSVPGKGTMKAGCRIPGNVSVSDFSCTSLDTTWTKYIYANSVIMECINGSVEGKFTLNDPAQDLILTIPPNGFPVNIFIFLLTTTCCSTSMPPMKSSTLAAAIMQTMATKYFSPTNASMDSLTPYTFQPILTILNPGVHT